VKHFLFLLITSTLLLAEKLTLGLGSYIQTQPYKGVDAILVPSPVIFYDNSLVYARWTRFGVYFLGEKTTDYSWGLSLSAQPRPYGYLASDSAHLQGMDERKNSFEGGVALSVQKEKAFFELMLFTDLLYKNKAYLLKADLGYEYKFGDLSLYPGLSVFYQSSDFTNYYYGVKQSEATPQRAFYAPRGDYGFSLHSYIQYSLSKQLSIFSHIKVEKLSKQAKESPLVEDATITSGLLSLIYTFHYE
jgi:outer membrane protein